MRITANHPRHTERSVPGLQLLIAALAISLLALSLASCGGNAQPAPVPSEQGRVVLNLLEDSIYEGGSISLDLHETDTGLRAEVVADGVSDLRALYIELEFDAAATSPVSASSGKLLEDAGEVLEISVLDQPGMVSYGQVLANWDRTTGFSGDGVLLTVEFADGPQQAARAVSSVPTGDSARAPLTVIAGTLGTTEILIASAKYTNPGDYDQNGEVGITDLTPLGLHFGETVETEVEGLASVFSNDPVQVVIDGDGNGEINIGDLTPIGTNFGNDVIGGYNFYASADLSDVPDANDAPSTIVPTGTFTGGTVGDDGDPAIERLNYGYLQSTVPPARVYFWARPVSSAGEEGTVSEVFELIAAPAPVLDLTAAPIGGAGTDDDPYQVEATTDHQVSLTHAVDGDVTASPQAHYMLLGYRGLVERDAGTELILRVASVAVEGLGSFDEATGNLELNDIYEGLFIMQAIYGGRMSNVLSMVVPDPDNIGPLAQITIEEDSGDTAPRSLTLSGANSQDTDGDIAAYAWDVGNDNSFEEINPGSQFLLDLEEGGEVPVTLMVTDDDGASSSTTITLRTTGWQRKVLDEVSETSPADPMIQTIDGNPAVAYRQFNTLKYIRAADSQGNTWNPSVAVPLSVTAEKICLREVSGRPAMTYQRTSSDRGIYYVLGNAPNATTFDQVQITSGAMDHSPTLNVIDGHPALAYAWHTGDSFKPYTLLYVRASDALGNTGGAWDLITAGQVIESETLIIDKTSLQVTDTNLIGTDGRPCLLFIADRDELGLDWNFYFMKATNASASTWSLPVEVSNNGNNQIKYPTVTSIVSRPKIAYFNPGIKQITYNYTPNLDGYDWGGAIVLPNGGEPNRGYHPSLANVGGFPALAYYDADDKSIRYIATSDPEGDTGWEGNGYVATAGEYDVTGSYSNYISLGAALGKPAIVFHDLTNAELVYSTYYEAP